MRLPKRLSRRQFLALSALGVPCICLGDGVLREPTLVKVREVKLRPDPTLKIVHITDIHYKGDKAYLSRVVSLVNSLNPQVVCFTGDLVEDPAYLPETLGILAGLRSPAYGCPGNHDYWSCVPFPDIRAAFRATGGDWLVNSHADSHGARFVGVSEEEAGSFAYLYAKPGNKDRGSIAPHGPHPRILLTHYPATVDRIQNQKYDLILAGHSHGGQIRIPLYGAPYLPYNVGRYDQGLFETKAGPLYVNPGLGTYLIPVRFFCRPEITLIHI